MSMPTRTKIKVLLALSAMGLTTCLGMAMAADPLASLTPKSKTVTATVTSGLLAEANSWYTRRETEGAVDRAIQGYSKILTQEPQNYEALWRLARCYWWQADHAAREQNKIFEIGQKIAERAIHVSPNSVEGHFWSGVCLGRASEVRGIFNSLFAVGGIREAMEAALKIDPHYEGALHVLGVLYRKAPGWPLSCGDMDKSLYYARLAVQAGPDVVLCHLGLAETLLAKGQKTEAKKVLEQALLLSGPPDRQPETRQDKQTVHRLLEQLH